LRGRALFHPDFWDILFFPRSLPIFDAFRYTCVGKYCHLKLLKKVEEAAKETLTYMNFPREHWRRIRTNNAMERLNREIRRRTRSIGAFPDGRSALMLVCATLRHIKQSECGQKTYLNMQHLEDDQPSDS
jgi:transposase-like protein